jgi:2-dehydropantoate 2-reductase
MKIGIIGGGSLGLLWAARLSQSAHVTLLCRTDKQAEKIQQDEIVLTTLEGQEIKYSVSAEWISQSNHSADFDVLFLMVKQPDLDEVLANISRWAAKNTPIVAWQNGLGHLDKIQQHHFANCYAVITTEGARKFSDNHVQHTGAGYVLLGRASSIDRLDPTLASFFQQIGIQVVDQIEYEMWKKVAINCVINPLTALLEIPNGQLMKSSLDSIINPIIHEIVQVAHVRGFQLQHEDIYHQVNDVCIKTAKNFSSMLQDILAKKQTEIASLNGMIVSYAEKYGVNASTNALLTQLIKAKSMSF